MTLFNRKLHCIALAGAITIAAWAGAAPAQAQGQYARPNGYPVTNVNLRAGPGTYYPVILVVPRHAPISILGCLGDYTWCDVLFQGNRGWMRSIYMQKWYQGYYYALGDWAPRLGIRVISFDIGPYWDSYYRDRPFYRDRGRWGAPFGEGWTNRAVFYNRLAPYGNWIWLQGQYVWVPRNVGPYWRPYTVGRWVFTDRYGWMWVSSEPFGWATYHYGRWGFSKRVGWFWVPGNRWAPAWVSWRQSTDYLAWAPLPPTPDEGFGLSIRVDTIPDYYWQAVPTQSFLSVDLSGVIVRDRNRFRPILQQTRPIGNVTVVNNTTIVNNVVNITHVEQMTKKKVVVHKVERTKDEKLAGKVEGATIEVFQPAAEEAPPTVAPPEAKPIEEVAAQSETKVQAEDAPSTEDLLVPEEIKKLPGKKEGTASEEAAAPPPPPAPSATPEAAEEAAPPPPPPPAEEEPAPAPATEAPPPPPAEDTPSAPPAEEGAPPPPPPAAEQEAPPPPPATEETPPPPPPGGEEAPPPPPAAKEAVPAPAPPAEVPTPKPKKQKGEERKKEKDESEPLEMQAPPPPPQEDVAPPPPAPPAPGEGAEPPPPPAPMGEEAPKQGKKGKKQKGNQGPPPQEGAPPPEGALPVPRTMLGTPMQMLRPPPPSAGEAPPEVKANDKPKGKKGKPPSEACPEGTVPLENGTCAPAE